MSRPQLQRILICIMVVFLLSLSVLASSEEETNLILNHDFSQGLDADSVPTHWVSFSRSDEANFQLSDERATVGSTSLKLVDSDANASVGVRSNKVDAEPGQRYLAEADVFVEQGIAMFYLDFHDARGQRIDAKTATTNVISSWQKLSVEAIAPEGTVYVTVILYASIPNVGTLYFDNIRLFDVSHRPIVLEERAPTNRELGYLPEEGAHVRVNPPPLVWLPVSGASNYIVEYSKDPSFAGADSVRVEDVTLSLHVPSQTLDLGVWHWRYWVRIEQGEIVGPSQSRSFIVTDGLPEMPLPPKEEWMANIPTSHPRLFLRPEDVEPLRERLNLRVVPTLFSKGHLASITGVDLPPEPLSPYATGALDIEVWRQGTNAMLPYFDLLQELSFLYVLTQKEDYGREGKALLLHLAAMDPHGATSYRGAPELGMRMIYFIPRAYTWFHDLLTEDERELVRQSARVRGQEAYNMIKGLPFETTPFSSHPGRMLGFLGQLSIALYDEIPEAEDWLDYVVTLMFGVYPAWGAEDGGYNEGHGYWNAYMSWVFDFVDTLKIATGMDLYQKPFFRNTGYFALYAGSVGMGRPFSDGQNAGPGSGDRNVMTHLARVHQDPYFSWYVNQIGGVTPRSVFQSLLIQEALPDPKAPTDLPNARWFRDVGWVTLHKDLANPKDNIQFTFKGSPFGSASHSHSDQNAFVLYAYGDGLAISSGYYPWSRSPHHEHWTNQTLSKNSLLIDGRGQPVFNSDATGEILGLFHSDVYDYTAGEAVKAYANPNLERFTRHVIYIRPDLFLLVDDVRASIPVSIDWLLHSRFELTWDQGGQSAHTQGRNATLAAHLLAPHGFQAKISDQFIPPPEVDQFQKEWHLTASLQEKQRETAIVSLLVPKKSNGDGPEVLHAEATVDGDSVGVEIQYRLGDQVTTEHIQMQLPASGEGGLASIRAVARDAAGQVQRAFATGGDQNGNADVTLSISEGWSVAVSMNGDEQSIALYVGRAEASAQGRAIPLGQGEDVRIAATFEPSIVLVNDEVVTDWTYDAGQGVVSVRF